MLRKATGASQQPERVQPGSSSSSVADDSQNLANLCVLILGMRISSRVPAKGGSSVSTLSVETSTRGRQPQPARQLPSASR